MVQSIKMIEDLCIECLNVIIFMSTFIYGSIINGHMKNLTMRRMYYAAYCHYKTQTQIKCLLPLKMSTSSSIMK